MRLLTVIFLLALAPFSVAGEPGDWVVRPYFGFSQMSDQSASTNGVGAQNGSADIVVDPGFTAGFGMAYRINSKFSAELAWEYRSNDSETTLADGDRYTEGNYASNTFFLNGIYHIEPHAQWHPYLGLGLSWIQEVDIDLERDGSEISYSGDGDIGFQAFAGVNYQVNKHWAWNAELRFGLIDGIGLTGEEGAVGRFDNLDYNTTTLQFGLSYAL